MRFVRDIIVAVLIAAFFVGYAFGTYWYVAQTAPHNLKYEIVRCPEIPGMGGGGLAPQTQ